MGDKYRFYRRFPVAPVPFPVAVPPVVEMLRIPPEVGPGYLEFWSPDCYASHVVRQSEDASTDPREYRTGPASKTGVFLPRGGSVESVVYSTARFAVKEYNGYQTAERPLPELRAKFYPALFQRPHVENQRFALITRTPFLPDAPAAGNPGLFEPFVFPPHYCYTCVMSTDFDLDVQIVNGIDGAVRQSRVVAQPDTGVPFSVGPWEFVNVAPVNQPSPSYQAVWSEDLTLSLV
jgi:hypothetical protein